MTNVVPLSEVLEIQNGFAFDSELFNDNASGTPIIRIRDLARGFTETYYNGDFDDKYLVKKDDFLIGMDGEFRCYQWKSEDALLNQRVCRLQNFSKKVNPKYIFYLINKYLIEIENNTAFVTVKHLSSKQINSIQIPLPPLPEQERIVRLLDEAEQVRKLRVQASTRMEDFVPALFREMFGNPAELEKMNWKFFPVGEFSDVSYGLADKLDANTPPESGTRIITISNVTLDGQINLSVERYSLADTSKREKARLKQGDLLFNWRNGSEIHVGKTALWEEQVSGEVLHVSFLLKIRPVKEKADSSYLWALLNSLRKSGFFTRQSRFQVNTKFNASELSALKLPLPPLDLQREFARRVSEAREVQSAQRRSEERVEALYQSMLSRAFAGEL